MASSTRFLQRYGAFGFLVVVGSTSIPSDTTRHVYGYGGILPIPPAAAGGEDATAATPDILGQRRSTQRTEKGRVLYANERVSTPAGPEATRPISSAARVKRPCTQIVQAHGTAGSPDS